MLRKKNDLWSDSELDLSSASDNDSVIVSRLSVGEKTSVNKNDDSSKIKCCLVCSVLPALSNINCCPKHLTLLTTTYPSTLPAKIIYMMPPTIDRCSGSECHGQSHCSKSKRQYRSSSSSSSSSISPSRKKKQSMAVKSSNTIDEDDLVLSPNMERTTASNTKPQATRTVHQQRRSNHVLIPLSSSFQPSSAINTNMNNNNTSRRRTRISSAPVVTRNTYRKKAVTQNKSPKSNVQQVNNQTTSPDPVELDSDLSHSPRILLKRVVHVNDDEALPTSNSQITLNMHQATKQRHSQPKILLKRVSLKK